VLRSPVGRRSRFPQPYHPTRGSQVCCHAYTLPDPYDWYYYFACAPDRAGLHAIAVHRNRRASASDFYEVLRCSLIVGFAGIVLDAISNFITTSPSHRQTPWCVAASSEQHCDRSSVLAASFFPPALVVAGPADETGGTVIWDTKRPTGSIDKFHAAGSGSVAAWHFIITSKTDT